MPTREPCQISQEVVHEKIGDEAVLLHLGTGVYFGLDPVGSRIWDLLIETGDPEIVLQRIAEEYDVSGDVARRDLEQLLHELIEKKLISVEEQSSSAPEPS